MRKLNVRRCRKRKKAIVIFSDKWRVFFSAIWRLHDRCTALVHIERWVSMKNRRNKNDPTRELPHKDRKITQQCLLLLISI